MDLNSLVDRVLGVIPPDETAELERLLIEKLAPVSPRPDYVGNLGKLLTVNKEPIAAHVSHPAVQLGLWQGLLLTAVGVASGVILVFLGVRAIKAARR